MLIINKLEKINVSKKAQNGIYLTNLSLTYNYFILYINLYKMIKCN